MIMSTDRNLLLGILAVQMNFVSRDELIAGMNAWVLAKQRPLGDILVEQHALQPARQRLLEDLVEEHLKTHHHDAAQSLAAASIDTSLREHLESIADRDVQASLAQVHGGSEQMTKAEPPGTFAPDRYRILRPHARGGLGEVFVAEDTELRREVALKEIQAQHADNAVSRARFLREAEITGRLEHPGVVPVYGLGRHADGRPFYAMRFIRGETLQKAIERFHCGLTIADCGLKGQSRTNPQSEIRNPKSYDSLEFRQLLQRFVAVCNVVAFAHSHGVLHRDLKPANVMLGDYGETLVVDWGLARVLRDKSRMTSDERPLLDSSLITHHSSLTQQGSALGTPAYMSPEQAEGDIDQVGAASDIYSLGATLYCLLTGRPPFVQGPDEGVGEVLQRVQRGEFAPPSQVNRHTPKSLEAVCLKAMALKPNNRYANAVDLAADIEHWLADEPVSCRRDPWMARLARGIRRRPRATATAVSLMVILVLMFAGWRALAMFQRWDIQSRADRLLSQAKEALAAGDAKSARNTLFEVDVLLRSVRAEKSSTSNTFGELLFRLGQWDAAVREFEEAIRLDPANFQAYSNLVLAHAERKDLPSAEAALQRCLARGPLPPAPEAQLWINLGVACERTRHYAEAVNHYQRAAELDPTEPLIFRNRAIALSVLQRYPESEADIRKAQQLAPGDGDLFYVQGNILADQRRHEEAVQSYTRALELSPKLRSARYNRGIMLRHLNRFDDALKDVNQSLAETPKNDSDRRNMLLERALNLANQRDFRAALDDLDAIVAQAPTDVLALITRGKVQADLSKDLIRSEKDLSLAIHLQPKEPDAYRSRGLLRMRAENWQGAIDDYQQYLKLLPEAPDAAGIWNDISSAHLSLNRIDEALAALANTEKLATTANSRGNRGNIYLSTGELDRAIADFDEALHLNAKYSRALVLRGHARLRQGRWSDAARDCEEALLVETRDDEARLLLGLALQELGRPKEAREHLQIVAENQAGHARGKVAHGLLNVQDRHFSNAISDLSQAIDDPYVRPIALRQRALAWLQIGPAGAGQAAADAEACCQTRPRDGFARFDAAMVMAQAAALSDAPMTKEQLSSRAVQLLSEARDRGFFREPANVEKLNKEPAFQSLHTRPDWRKLVQELGGRP
jgi:serine/threonine protein kinase/Tfp pilus assembly protein PilF